MNRAYNMVGADLGFNVPVMRVGESIHIDNKPDAFRKGEVIVFKGKLKKIIHTLVDGQHEVEYWFKVKEWKKA
jgi:cytochrome c-type biogenesis protein CcmE